MINARGGANGTIWLQKNRTYATSAQISRQAVTTAGYRDLPGLRSAVGWRHAAVP